MSAADGEAMANELQRHARWLRRLAGALLRDAAAADDLVQEAWLRWRSAERAAVDDPKAYLASVVTRLSIDRLRELKRRREEYVCTSCNMDLVADVYNRLHTRDDLVFCPSCRRILYIPEDLPPEAAVHRKKPAKPRKEKAANAANASGVSAAAPRQQSAVDVMNSITPETDQPDQQDQPDQPDRSAAPQEDSAAPGSDAADAPAEARSSTVEGTGK